MQLQPLMPMENPRPMIPDEAQEAADRGDLITAIKITRRIYGLGLQEAKQAVDRYQQGIQFESDSSEVSIPEIAIAALQSGQYIQAIKQTRESTGLGLKDSKQLVERYLAAHPDLQAQMRSALPRDWRGIRQGLIFISLFLVAIVAIVLIANKK